MARGEDDDGTGSGVPTLPCPCVLTRRSRRACVACPRRMKEAAAENGGVEQPAEIQREDRAPHPEAGGGDGGVRGSDEGLEHHPGGSGESAPRAEGGEGGMYPRSLQPGRPGVGCRSPRTEGKGPASTARPLPAGTSPSVTKPPQEPSVRIFGLKGRHRPPHSGLLQTSIPLLPPSRLVNPPTPH